MLERICELVESPPDGVPIDAVLVAGDVYDRGVPPVESVRLFEWTLAGWPRSRPSSSRRATTTRRSGSATAPACSATASGWSPTSAGLDLPVLLEGSDGVRAAVYGIPYLDPDTRELRWPAAGSRCRARTRPSSGRRATASAPTSPDRRGVRSVVLAHAFVAGAEPSDSERSIMVGGVDRVAGTVFAGIDYAALGHLHGPQSPESADGSVVRYSGSPLRYSFSEQDHTKVVLLVDVPAAGPVRVTPVEIEQPRPWPRCAAGSTSCSGRRAGRTRTRGCGSRSPTGCGPTRSWTGSSRASPRAAGLPRARRRHRPRARRHDLVSERDPRELGPTSSPTSPRPRPSAGEVERLHRRLRGGRQGPAARPRRRRWPDMQLHHLEHDGHRAVCRHRGHRLHARSGGPGSSCSRAPRARASRRSSTPSRSPSTARSPRPRPTSSASTRTTPTRAPCRW